MNDNRAAFDRLQSDNRAAFDRLQNGFQPQLDRKITEKERANRGNKSSKGERFEITKIADQKWTKIITTYNVKIGKKNNLNTENEKKHK